MLRFGPRLNGTLVERLALVRHDEVEIEINGVAEALASRAGAVRIVEGKQARLRLLIHRAAAFAFEALVEHQPLGLPVACSDPGADQV